MSQLPNTQQKANFVQNMFGRIADKYDLMNDLMTTGLHRLWKKQVCKSLNIQAGHKVLDLCCGTGDLTTMLSRTCSEAEIIGLDFSGEMLSFAKERVTPKSSSIQFVQGDALNLPFADNTFDRAVVSFGLRNVSDYEQCLREVFRVCKGGAKFMILDLSHPNAFWHYLSYPYRYWIVPLLGKLIAGESAAYSYLPNSIQNYPDQAKLAELMSKAGWHNVTFHNIFGGVVAIHEGFKQ